MADTELSTIDELVAAAATGDREAFTKLIRLMMNQVVALTYRMTGDQDAAKDLAQETFITIWQKLAEFRGESRFESWVYRIATNKTLNWLKQRKSAVDVNDETSLISTANPESELYRSELKQQVLSFAGGLPEGQRIVFELRFYKELQFQEIADLTGKALGTVKTHYREAVAKLRHLATEKGWRS